MLGRLKRAGRVALAGHMRAGREVTIQSTPVGTSASGSAGQARHRSEPGEQGGLSGVFFRRVQVMLNLKFLCDRTLPFDKKLPLCVDNGYHLYSTASRSLKAITWPNEREHSRLSFGHVLAFSDLNAVEKCRYPLSLYFVG